MVGMKNLKVSKKPSYPRGNIYLIFLISEFLYVCVYMCACTYMQSKNEEHMPYKITVFGCFFLM